MVSDPNNDPLSSVRDLESTPYSYLGANVFTNETFLWTPQNHYGAEPIAYDRDERCEFAIRLTDSIPNSHGSITTIDKQQVLYGFETDISFRILFPST